jgi:hypothetical protein
LGNGGVERLEAAAIGERIRRHVQNAHHRRPGLDRVEEGVTFGAQLGAHHAFSLAPGYSQRHRTATHLGCSPIHCAM